MRSNTWKVCLQKKKDQEIHSDSSDSDEEDSWKSGYWIKQAEQLHVLASANMNPNERNLEFDKDDLKRYKK